jgi:hypothetical protein
MSGKWVDAWPPFWVEARGETTTLLVRVTISTPGAERAIVARMDARVSAGYDERRGGRLSVEVSGVRSRYRVRVEVPHLGVDTGVSHAHGWGEVALIDVWL